MNRLRTHTVISQDNWIDQNSDMLRTMYSIIQDMNDSSGRRIFDRDKCDFSKWCQLAYQHSTVYSRGQQWMYTDDEDDEDDAEYYHGTDN